MRCRLLAALAAAALLAAPSHARRLLSGGGLGGSLLFTPAGELVGAAAEAGVFFNQVLTAMGAGTLMEFLVFDKLQSAFLTQARRPAQRVQRYGGPDSQCFRSTSRSSTASSVSTRSVARGMPLHAPSLLTTDLQLRSSRTQQARAPRSSRPATCGRTSPPASRCSVRHSGCAPCAFPLLPR